MSPFYTFHTLVHFTSFTQSHLIIHLRVSTDSLQWPARPSVVWPPATSPTDVLCCGHMALSLLLQCARQSPCWHRTFTWLLLLPKIFFPGYPFDWLPYLLPFFDQMSPLRKTSPHHGIHVLTCHPTLFPP